jgi:hypothetical protein
MYIVELVEKQMHFEIVDPKDTLEDYEFLSKL